MLVLKTLNLVDSANKAAWEQVFDKNKAVNEATVSVKLPDALRAQVLDHGVREFSNQLKHIRAAERAVPESLLRMKLR